jgi:hypothetical protein
MEDKCCECFESLYDNRNIRRAYYWQEDRLLCYKCFKKHHNKIKIKKEYNFDSCIPEINTITSPIRNTGQHCFTKEFNQF